MPASPSKDQALVEQLLIELNKIGVGPTEWLTVPSVPTVEAEAPTKPADNAELQLFLVHDLTRATDEDAGGLGMHNRTWIGGVVICARADASGGRRKKIRQAAADVLRALYAAEGTFYTLTGDTGLRVGDLGFQNVPDQAWFGCGVIDLTAQYESSHSAP